MTIRDNIAANLRELCTQKGSIAQACREAGINRQQFNRYLTGEAIPNRSNLEKICACFGISETELFQDPQLTAVPAVTSTPLELKNPDCSRIFDNMTSTPPATISDGTYYIYFGFSEEGAEIARSVMFVRSQGPLRTFRRITNISALKPAAWHYYHGHHRGIVLERRHWLYFAAISGNGREEPSLIATQWTGVNPPLLTGTALVFGISEPLTLPVIMEPLPPDTGLREALRGCNIYSVESPEIRPLIKKFLDLQKNKITAP